jgi:hypothetical protein
MGPGEIRSNIGITPGRLMRAEAEREEMRGHMTTERRAKDHERLLGRPLGAEYIVCVGSERNSRPTAWGMEAITLRELRTQAMTMEAEGGQPVVAFVQRRGRWSGCSDGGSFEAGSRVLTAASDNGYEAPPHRVSDGTVRRKEGSSACPGTRHVMCRYDRGNGERRRPRSRPHGAGGIGYDTTR